MTRIHENTMFSALQDSLPVYFQCISCKSASSRHGIKVWAGRYESWMEVSVEARKPEGRMRWRRSGKEGDLCVCVCVGGKGSFKEA